ncbi:MAG: helix-turn-helix domain-containing protein [Bacteroidetes bacterium]|nr:helix-turn-helix domain-containing protein [Bacteroidota bacterium]
MQLPQGYVTLARQKPPEYLNVSQVAEKLQLSCAGVMALIYSGHLPASYTLNEFFINRRDLERYLANQAESESPPV